MKRTIQVTLAVSIALAALPEADAGSLKQRARAAVEKPTRKLFRAIARKKSGRVFHDRGAAYSGSLELAPGNPLGRSGKLAVTVRMSRGTDKAQPKSTALGAAIRVPDGQGGADDLLMVSSGEGRVRRRLVLPSASFFGKTTYSSLLPFELGGTKQLLRLVPEDTAARPKKRTDGSTDLGELADAVERGAATFTLLAEPLRGGGGKTVIGRVVLEQRMSDEVARALRFDPWSNRNVIPAGFINKVIRRAAYRGSQEGRFPH